MKAKRPLARKIFWIVLVPLVFEVSFLSAIFLLLNRAEREYQAETHAGEIIGELNLCMTDVTGVGMFTYIYLLTGSERPKRNAKRSAEQMQFHIEPLRSLVANDDSETKESVAQFIKMFEQTRRAVGATGELSVKKMIASPSESNASIDKEGAVAELRIGRESSRQVAALGDKIIGEQLKVSSIRRAKYEEFRSIVDLMLKAGVLISFAISLGLIAYFTRYVSRRISTLTSNTVLYASNRPLSPPIEGEDEIAMLDKIFRASAQTLEEAGRRERVALENAANVILSLDSSGRVISINRTVEKLWGYRVEDWLGARLSHFVVGSDAESFGNKMSEITRSGKGSFESQLRKADGSLADVLWALSMSDNERTLACVAHDISERKQIEHLKFEFSDVMRRGLHVPLDSIQALFKRMEESTETLPPRAVAKAASGQKEVSRLIRLLDEFVDIDVRTDGKGKPNFHKIYVQELVDSASSAVKDWAGKRNVTIVVKKSEANVEADGGQIVRVLVNLISNAIKFSPPEAEVKVEVEQVVDFIEFQVSDSGPGIAPENQAAVFEKFKQLDQPLQIKASGTGLGLAICQSIVSMHNGSIGVRSDGQSGSTFWFRLPKIQMQKESGGEK